MSPLEWIAVTLLVASIAYGVTEFVLFLSGLYRQNRALRQWLDIEASDNTSAFGLWLERNPDFRGSSTQSLNHRVQVMLGWEEKRRQQPGEPKR